MQQSHVIHPLVLALLACGIRNAGIFQPSKFPGDETKTPGVPAMASYDWKGAGTTGKRWAGLVS